MSGGTRLWGGRFSGGPVEAFDRLNASLATDQRMWAQDIAGSVAHVSMLVTCGILPGEDGEAVIRALAQVHQEFATDQFTPAASDEDIHTAVERRVTEIAGDAGARMHTARSRNDQVATDVLLYLREALVGQLAGLRRLVDALLEQARQHVDTLVPGYTHLQRAQPVRLAHHLLAYVWMLARDRARLVQVRDVSLMECPLGAGALSGVGFPIDRARTATALGFARPTRNSLDSVASRDALADYLHAVATLGVHLSRMGEELVLWSSEEFGFVVLSDGFTSGSSMLPQKKNPDAAELARAKAARLIGDYAGLQNVVAKLPLAYNKDLQEDKHYLFDAVDTIDLLVPAVGGMVMTARFQPERMLQACEAGYLAATDLADHLVRLGWPFRRAHEAVGQLVRSCAERGVGLGDVSPAELAAAGLAGITPPPVTAEASAEAKVAEGGTSRERVLEQLAAAEAEVGAW
ncbi:MAG: argininosuccinate lyase [Actinobacteria bacterium]|nr:argininosuccinate lyase [Thermoleophilia bacterium]MCB9011784.1 argininosuccinate lyase [Actinomycetota bacterium]